MLRYKILSILFLFTITLVVLNINCGTKDKTDPQIYPIKTPDAPLSDSTAYGLKVEYKTESDFSAEGGQNRIDLSWSYFDVKPEIKLSWEFDETVDKYEIYRSTAPDDKGILIAEVDTKEYIDKNVKEGKTYYYSIVCKNGEVMSKESDKVKATAIGDYFIKGYNLYRKLGSSKNADLGRISPELIDSSTAGSFEDTNLPSETEFHYILEAVTIENEVIDSSEIVAKTLPPDHQEINASMRVLNYNETKNELTLEANVFDQAGDVVQNLDPSNFEIQANIPSIGNITASISSIIPVNPLLPLSGACTLDYSGSMLDYDKSLMEYTLVTGLLMLKKPLDEYEIIKFSTNVDVPQSFTSDTNTLVNAIFGTYSGAGGSTALFDSIYQGIDDVVNLGANSEKYVVAFTDGCENASTHTMADLTAISTSNSVPVYVVAYGFSDTHTCIQEIQDIAMNTGGAWVNGNGTGLYQTSWTQTQNGYVLTITASVPLIGTYDINFVVNYNGMTSSWTYTVTVT